MTITKGNGETTAHIGTNKEYAMYVEFGTGPKGLAHHEGTSPDFPVSYRTSPWWIHESQVDPQAAAVYHWPSITTDQGKFYRVQGQPAHPFLYPALHDNEDVIGKIIKKGIDKAME